ncbi:fibronectin type III domain-containing protein [Patescibacteria group bacterium]
MKKKGLKKKLPALLGILLLVIGSGVGIFLVKRDTGFIPRAAPEFAPKDLTVTNINENSFSISWVTDQKTVGFLRYGNSSNSIKTLENDDRDQLTGGTGTYYTHHVTIRDLEPQTKYYFKVASGGEGQLYDDNGQPYEVETAPVLGTPPPADTAYGEVLTAASTPAEGAIVYVSLPDAGRLSTLVSDGGQWALSISTARTSSMRSYVEYDKENTLMDILIKSSPLETSKVVVSTGSDQPVPSVTISQDYDFSEQQQIAAPETEEEKEVLDKSATESAKAVTKSGFNLSPIGDVVEATEELTILNPSDDFEAVDTTLPEFLGTAPAGTQLIIEVNSENEITDTVVVDESNYWSWSPPENLEPGEHDITVSFTDENGILQSIKRSFTVYAQGTNPAFTATPSATPIPTPTPTPAPRVSQPATGSGVPESGSVEVTFALLILGLILIGGGIVWEKKVV